MALYKILDLRSGATTVVALQRTADLIELDAHGIEWAIEEHGVCETDRHTITLVGDAVVEDEQRCKAVITGFFSLEELEEHLASPPSLAA